VIFGGDPSHWSLTEEEKTSAKRFVTAVRSEPGTRGTLIDATPSSANRLTHHL